MKAVTQYLQTYAEPEARNLLHHPLPGRWRQVLVIPAYAEPPAVAERLYQQALATPGLLQLLVLNRPDIPGTEHSNDELRSALGRFAVLSTVNRSNATLLDFNCDSHLLVLERPLPMPANEGVGLARKLGCDVALALGQAGKIHSRWINNTDADAELPPAYFAREQNTQPRDKAIVHPFVHRAAAGQAISASMLLYELRLHHYRRGLAWAGSPYAFFSLGSCISVTGEAYAGVRGFPRRAAAEDFYLLNKLAKTGAICSPAGQAIRLSSRRSSRVPFGTGPAVGELEARGDGIDPALFYHPRSFGVLRQLLATASVLYQLSRPKQRIEQALAGWPAALAALEQAGVEEALEHCARHARDLPAWLRHFHQWFDGFRTLKLLHALRDDGLANTDLRQSLCEGPQLWPEGATDAKPERLLQACHTELGWTDAW